ncbi:MAG: N-acetylneuraminate synthase family protein [Magnetococcales bacterium]|nr:N-acetylneuraminate synthase family protein [Magnetococcales bacterium]
MSQLIPEQLFILEMANNHMGSVEHGLHVIRTFAEVCKPFPFRFAFKMQYRQLDTFIHPDYRDRMDIKYIKRFSETSLSREDTRRLADEIKAQGFLAICTPFDQDSVACILEDGFDVLKIASCSFTDWPLLERIGACDLPVIGSTAGIDRENMDNVVSFMKHREKEFVLMHCVAEYPTPNENLQLNQIDFLKQRYPGLRIGYSTHEEPSETAAVGIAIGKGCSLFERHVAVPTEVHGINGYSSTPEQVRAWLEAAQKGYALCGQTEGRIEPTQKERDSLISLRRGVFAKKKIAAGDRIQDSDVFMAIPTQEHHVTANDWSKYNHFYASRTLQAGEPILTTNTRSEQVRQRVYAIAQQVKQLLKKGNVILPGEAQLEVSHHYGIDQFESFGISMITVVNRRYCKKLIVVLPGQSHPEQYHKQKEETFHILHGVLNIALDGESKERGPGSVITIEPGVRHAFDSQEGCVFEEISSTHYTDDSFYTDPAISQNPSRKTFISFWLS